MKSLCIIPARGGSKRIPRKNVRPFHGKPIIAYPIAAALASGCFDEVMVSTEDEEIAAIARECGATVPFLRSNQNATDHAGSDEVIKEVILRYRELGRAYPEVCALYPTAVLVTAAQIRQGRDLLLADPTLTSVLPVLRFSFPIQRALVRRANRVPLLHPEFYHSRSQDLEPAYHDAGQWYWLNSERFLQSGEFMGEHANGLVLSGMEAQDVDSEDDWALAELKFQLARLRAAAA